MATPACVPNIGPSGIRRRRVIGLVCLALALWSASRLAAAGAPPFQYISLAPLFLGAALGWSQAREQTCLLNAARGLRESDAEGPAVFDGADQAAVRRQAWRAVRLAGLATLVLTALTVAAGALLTG